MATLTITVPDTLAALPADRLDAILGAVAAMIRRSH